MSLLKPYLLVACVAFSAGFVGYWAMHAPLSPAPAAARPSPPAAISVPAGLDPNPAKHI